MNNPGQIYQPPENHDDHIKKMGIWLAVFFTTLTVVVILVIVFAQELSKFLPFSAEKRFVKPYEKLASYYFDDEPSEHELAIEAYLTDLGTKLAKDMDIPQEYGIQFHYLDTSSINAFATLGGHIFVFRGLIEAMPDENSLAMVMAHELAHIKHRDPAAAMSRGLALQMLYSFVSGDYASGADLAFESSEFGLLYFSREQERMADKAAVHALNNKYDHSGGYDTLFNHLMEEQKEEEAENDESHRWGEWLSTHPDLDKRIEAMNELIDSQDYLENGSRTPIPDQIKLHMSLLSKFNNKKEAEEKREKAKKELEK